MTWVFWLSWSCAFVWVFLMWREEGKALKEARNLLDDARKMREQHREFFAAVRRGDPNPTRYLPPLSSDMPKPREQWTEDRL